MKECIIVGAGTYGQVYAEYFKEKYSVIGFIDDDLEKIGVTINGVKVLGDFKHLLEKVPKKVDVFVPIGNNLIRTNFIEILNKNNFNTPSFIHAGVSIHPTVTIGIAVYILPGTNIMPHAKIDDYVMISMGVNIAHHTILGKGSFFSQGTNVGASIIIDKNSFCGIGSTIMTGVKHIGKFSTIGAGALILKDIPDYAVVVGNPGKIIKYNEK